MKRRGKLHLKAEEESWHTVLRCRWPNKVSCKSHSSTSGISMHTFPKEAKQKKDGRPSPGFTCTDWPALCSEHFEALYFSRSVLIGTPVDFQRFYLEKGSIPSIYAKPKDSLDIDFPKNEGRLANRLFPEKPSLRPYRETSVSKISPPPQKKKKEIDFFSDWVGLFEICFRSSEMTDPRPCPRGWAYFRVPSGSTKTCQAQLNQQQIISCKNRYLLGVRETSQCKTAPSPNVYGTFLKKKSICPESSLNNSKAS